MISPTFRLCTNRVKTAQFFEEAVRRISKTSSVTNVDVIFQRKDEVKNERKEKRLFKLRKSHRCLSSLTTKALPQVATTFQADPEKTKDFMDVFPEIVSDLTEDGHHKDIHEINKWYTKVLQYTVPLGKRNRAVELTLAYKMLAEEEDLTPENIKLAYILGWCCEMFHASFVISDDIVDNASTRRGAPCWYKQEGVGLSGFNDAIMVHSGLYAILRKYFHNHPAYTSILEMFHDMTLKTAMGHSLDTHCHRSGRPNLDIFTMDRYNAIAKYKTSSYTFQMPVALAMYMACIYNQELHRQAKHILLEIGHFLQVQDDFLDCFGNPEITGKEPVDIREGKCTWLAVVALQRASQEQRKLFGEHYGRHSKESIEIVKDIYEELSLPNTFAVYEEKSFNLIRTHIQQMSGGLPHKLFFKILEKVYGRDKPF